MVVTPQSPECYPPSYPSAMSPTHHLPPYLTHHPHFIQNSHTAYYPPVTVPGDMPPQFFPQPHLPPTIYSEQGEWVPAGIEISPHWLHQELMSPLPSVSCGMSKVESKLTGTKLMEIPGFLCLGFCLVGIPCVCGWVTAVLLPPQQEHGVG